MRTIGVIAALAGVLVFAPAARAQTFSHLNIDIEGNVVSLAGGERGSVRMPTDGVVIGKTTRTTITRRESACGLGLGLLPQPGSVVVWSIEVTPLQVYAGAVTFQLKWARVRDDGREASSPSGDVRVTLQPGQSLPVDSWPIPAQTTMPAGICDLKAVTVRVAVSFWPRAADDSRVVNTEMWLVERRQDGSERSSPLMLRGAFNQPTPFYFEPVMYGNVEVQLYGSFTLTPVGTSYSMKLETWCRPSSGSVAARPDAAASRLDALRAMFGLANNLRVESVLSLTPGEVIDVQLPKLVERAGPGAASGFAIRIRARQAQ